jgi:hypothetical protein
MTEPHERSPDTEWTELGERLVQLAVYATQYDDDRATAEIAETIKPVIRRMVMAAHPNDREHHLSVLLELAIIIVKRMVVFRPDKPMSYLYESLRRRYHRELQRLRRRNDTEVPSGSGSDYRTERAHHDARVDDGLIREELRKNSSDLAATGNANNHRMALVIEVAYLLDVSVGDACDALSFTRQEKKTIVEKITRQRSEADSSLVRLAERALGYEVRPNKTIPRKTPKPSTAQDPQAER